MCYASLREECILHNLKRLFLFFISLFLNSSTSRTELFSLQNMIKHQVECLIRITTGDLECSDIISCHLSI